MRSASPFSGAAPREAPVCITKQLGLLLPARLIYAFLQLPAPIQPDLTLADAK